jgi:hypothetical protein
MRWSDIPFNPPPATLRWFGVLGALVLVVLAGRRFFAHDDATFALVLLGLAIAVATVGLVVPAVLRPVFVGWMVVIYPISWVTSRLLLACVFYCLFTPLGLFFKLLGRDALARRLRADQDSYWAAKPAAADVRSYFRQS